LTVKDSGGELPAGVGGAEKEKRARCLGIFQLTRPLYVVVRWETYMRHMRRAFFGILKGVLDEGVGTVKLPGMRISSSYGPARLLVMDHYLHIGKPGKETMLNDGVKDTKSTSSIEDPERRDVEINIEYIRNRKKAAAQP